MNPRHYQYIEAQEKQNELHKNCMLQRRFSENLPDYSIVQEATINNNMLDINEMSWLQKLGEGTTNQNYSKILQGQQLDLIDKQLKFSFNGNYPTENKPGSPPLNPNTTEARTHKCESKENSNFTCEETSKESRSKGVLAGSIRRNQSKGSFESEMKLKERKQVAANQGDSRLQEMTCRINKALQNQTRKQNLNRDKQNQYYSITNLPPSKKYKLFAESRQYPRLDSASLAKTRTENLVQVETKKDKIALCLEGLFAALDSQRVGKLSSTNCQAENIKEELKYLFGAVFTKIKLRGETVTKAQFIEKCEKIVSENNSSNIVNLLSAYQLKEDKGQLQALDSVQSKKTKCEQSLCETKKQLRLTKYCQEQEIRQVSQQKQQAHQQTIHSSHTHTHYENCGSFLNGSDKNQRTIWQEKQRRRADISEQKLREHKKNLKNLNELTEKVENVLKLKLVSGEGAREEGKGSLKFQELLKHI